LLVGLVLMLPGHVIGRTGAGDVKLLAALGTLLGPRSIAMAFLYTAIAGGVLAVMVAMRRRRLRETLGGTATLIYTRGANAGEIEKPTADNRFAYAPAIAIGAVVAAFGL
jgi:prepilin peptidase CpaA